MRRILRARSPDVEMRHRWLLCAFVTVLSILFLILGLAQSAGAIQVISHSANATVITGVPFAEAEFENPLTGTESVQGFDILEWRDADFIIPGPSYDDWTVSHPGQIDGNPNEIWLRRSGHSASTTTTVNGTIVSVHLNGDDNDGVAQVLVDGNEVARLDMGTKQPPDRAIVIVTGLANVIHSVTVNDLGTGPQNFGDDVAILGAAVLKRPVRMKWDQPPDPGGEFEAFLGWNQYSVHESERIAADDFVCVTPQPITDIHWWGSFIGWNQKEPPPARPVAFHIAIWTDVPKSETNPWSHPGKVVWEIDCVDFQMEFAGWDYDPRDGSIETCYRYTQLLKPHEWFEQEPGENIYWISIAAVYDDGTEPVHPWGWKTRPRDPASPAPDDAVAIKTPTGARMGDEFQDGEPLFWPREEESWDLCFNLTTQADLNKWEQMPNPQYPGLHAHDWMEQGVHRWITLADDWICQGGQVTGFRWWGNYETDPLGTEKRGSGIKHFHVSIHPLIINGPPPVPGPEIVGYDIPFIQTGETFTGLVNSEGSMIYSYDVILPEPFPQELEKIYWLDITAYSNMPTNPALWRWQESNRSINPRVNPAVKSDTAGPWSPIIWGLDPPRFTDLAYVVNSGSPGMFKWRQEPERIYLPSFNGWNEPSVYNWNQIVADDWACKGPAPVIGVHWWGSFVGWSKSQPPRVPDAFHMAVWTDVPSGPLPWSHPGQVIWETTCREFTWNFAGWDIDPRDPMAAPEALFAFDQDIPVEEWFRQGPDDKILWLSIAAIYDDVVPERHIYGWKTRPRVDYPAPDDAVKIFIPTNPKVGSVFQQGLPLFWPTEQQSWDVCFALRTVSLGVLRAEINKLIPDHPWHPGLMNVPNSMMSLNLKASPNEAIQVQSLTLQASGTGNDATHIQSVNCYRDVNDNGMADAADVLLASTVYTVDDGTATLVFGAPPLIIPAGQTVPLVIAYMMNPAPAYSTFRFALSGASATGMASGAPVPVNGLPLTSALKRVAPAPITIGDAKKLEPLGSTVFLQGKLVAADYRAGFNIFYIREDDRSAGIGVVPRPGTESGFTVGAHISVLGTNAYMSGESTEVVIDGEAVWVSSIFPVVPIPLHMNNRTTGGGQFGLQPAVIDDAFATPRKESYGLSNVGNLIRTWGRVTGTSSAKNVVWIDDGTNLQDGNLLPSGARAMGLAVLMPPLGTPLPVGSYVGVTGTLWSVPAGTSLPEAYPVRLLVPRDASDIDILQPAPGP